MFGGCFGGVVCVGFTGSAGFRGDFDNDFSSTSCVVRPAAENETKIYLLISRSVIRIKKKKHKYFVKNSFSPCLEVGVGLEVSVLPLSCLINDPLIFLRTCNCSPSRLIGITLSCFEETGVAFESSLVPLLFMTCDGDPEDN